MKFAAIADWADSDEYPVTFMCRELGVSTSGYYDWRNGKPSQRAQTDGDLIGLFAVEGVEVNRASVSG